MRQRLGLFWKEISDYRSELFGLSIICIIIFHYFEGVAAADYLGKALKLIATLFNGAIGSVGVDVFLFLSGYGIWYALRKKPLIKDFYIKRIRRVLIPYLFMGGIFWMIKDIIINKVSFNIFLYDFSLLSFWGSGVRTFWYISLICLLYICSPLVFQGGKKAYITISLISVMFSICLYFADQDLFRNIEVAILRIPVYFLGMYCADLSGTDTSKVNRFVLWVTVLFVPVKLAAGLYDFPFSRLFNAGYAVFLIFLYIVFRKLVQIESISRFLVKTGSLSLELYIVHVAIRNIMGTLGMKTGYPHIYCIVILFSIPIALFFSRLENGIIGRTKMIQTDRS